MLSMAKQIEKLKYAERMDRLRPMNLTPERYDIIKAQLESIAEVTHNPEDVLSIKKLFTVYKNTFKDDASGYDRVRTVLKFENANLYGFDDAKYAQQKLYGIRLRTKNTK